MLMKSPIQNHEGTPYKFPHEGHHEKGHSSCPSDKLSIPMKLKERVQGKYNSSWQQGQKFQSNQYPQPVKILLQQDTPFTY